jgi:hypothetical protein
MRLPGTTQKRLYILGTKENRERALAECQNAVEYKMSGKAQGGSVSSWRDRGAARYDQSYTRRSRSRRYHITPPSLHVTALPRHTIGETVFSSVVLSLEVRLLYVCVCARACVRVVIFFCKTI